MNTIDRATEQAAEPQESLALSAFVDLVAGGFEKMGARLDSFYENRLELEITNLLLDRGFKAFMEYPYSVDGTDTCDIAITRWQDVEAVTHWIEIKPLWKRSPYRTPSKFIKEGPFRHDIVKLAKQTAESNRWYVVIVFSDDGEIMLEGTVNPRERKAMTIGQVARIVSLWACSKPAAARSFRIGSGYCHLLFWDVIAFNECVIAVTAGEYMLPES